MFNLATILEVELLCTIVSKVHTCKIKLVLLLDTFLEKLLETPLNDGEERICFELYFIADICTQINMQLIIALDVAPVASYHLTATMDILTALVALLEHTHQLKQWS